MSVHAVAIQKLHEHTPYIANGDGTAYPLDAQQLRMIIDFLNQLSGTELLTTGEASKILGVSSKTVARLVDSGVLPAIRYSKNGNRLLRMQDVVSYRDNAERERKKSA